MPARVQIKRIHTCTICRAESEWGDDWNWYGSYNLIENYPHLIVITCSDECRTKFNELQTRGLMRLPTLKKTSTIGSFTIKEEQVGY